MAEFENSILGAGSAAPDFTLPTSPDQTVSLAQLRGRPAVLIFYPADWSPVCGDELALFNEIQPDIEELGARLLGISVDGVWCHAAFARDRKLRFPLLSDFEPKGAVSRQYGAYREGDGTSARALFVLDGNGEIRWSYLSPINVNPGADGVMRVLESMATKSAASETTQPASPRAGSNRSTEARP